MMYNLKTRVNRLEKKHSLDSEPKILIVSITDGDAVKDISISDINVQTNKPTMKTKSEGAVDIDAFLKQVSEAWDYDVHSEYYNQETEVIDII